MGRFVCGDRLHCGEAEMKRIDVGRHYVAALFSRFHSTLQHDFGAPSGVAQSATPTIFNYLHVSSITRFGIAAIYLDTHTI
jgi:hypothetical protein